MKKQIILLFLTTLLSACLFSQTKPNTDKVIGVWLSEAKDNKIEIYKQGSKYYGKFIWSTLMYEADGVTSKKDLKNEDKTLRNREIKNLTFITDFIYEDEEWVNGSIYDISGGKTYNGTIKINDNGKLALRGYLGIPMLGKTALYNRVK